MSSTPVILVTAGTAGLGAAVTRLFAGHGFRVVINYNSNVDRAVSLLAELRGANPEKAADYAAIQADLGSLVDVERLVQETYDAMGRIDVIFSNGGWTKFRDTTSIDDNCFEEDLDRAFAINVKSHLWLLRAARQHLEQTEGAFITTSSIAGVRGMGSSLAYSATKAAQIHMVKGLASMVAPKIRVNSVSPGLLQTEWAARFSEEQKESHRQGTKLKRFVEIEDVAEQVLGLARSKSMTGVNVIVDAGFTI
ncbi:hypothetical protein QQZ08_007991 [Neonectria magnoliae]|uniref:Granaticin polyketide synthase ketoacyl reductase 2 n=1 Tax=Neonectria magnoliae TaxID=2732573 RepID=A0ABR1HWD3_9HYPO